MAHILRTLRGGTNTAYNVEISEQIALFQTVKKQTNHLVSALLHFTADLNGSNSPNRFERLGEILSAYGSKGPDPEANAALKAQRTFFDSIGRAHRIFTTQIEEQVIKPLNVWMKNEYHLMNEEVKRLDKLRHAMDTATDKARKAAGNTELDAARAEAERVYNQQLQLVSEKLEEFFNNSSKSHSAILLKIVQCEQTLYEETTKVIKVSY